MPSASLCFKQVEAVTCSTLPLQQTDKLLNALSGVKLSPGFIFKTKAELCTDRGNSFKREGLLLNT